MFYIFIIILSILYSRRYRYYYLSMYLTSVNCTVEAKKISLKGINKGISTTIRVYIIIIVSLFFYNFLSLTTYYLSYESIAVTT